MTSKTLTITNAQGFHMRPAGAFAAAMAKFNSNVTIKFNGSDVNGKSLMNIIAAGIKCGSTIEICQNYRKQPVLLFARDTLVAIGREESKKIMVGGAVQ